MSSAFYRSLFLLMAAAAAGIALGYYDMRWQRDIAEYSAQQQRAASEAIRAASMPCRRKHAR